MRILRSGTNIENMPNAYIEIKFIETSQNLYVNKRNGEAIIASFAHHIFTWTLEYFLSSSSLFIYPDRNGNGNKTTLKYRKQFAQLLLRNKLFICSNRILHRIFFSSQQIFENKLKTRHICLPYYLFVDISGLRMECGFFAFFPLLI